MTETLISTTTPRCPHFGTCGGCQYQNLAYPEQLHIKRVHLEDLLQQANIEYPPDITLHSAEPYGYRNRIRLRVERIESPGDKASQLHLGYNIRTTTTCLPITTCPIAAPILWSTAESLLTAATKNRDTAYWLNAAVEVELFCNNDLTRVQLTLFCAPRTKSQPGSFTRMMNALQTQAPQIIGAAAVAFSGDKNAPRTGPTARTLAEDGAAGLSYKVLNETYWITRGSFFQANRFLLETLVQLVCTKDGNPRTGTLAWDLYAGVGLFSRIFARSFARITAVEANPTAAADLRAALNKISPNSIAIESTTLDFLRRAILDRDRPELIVLDPPRAGAGLEACELLTRIAAPQIIYVSCDPAALVRDLKALQPLYRIKQLHLVDLFPQTSHQETIAFLERSRNSSPPPTMTN
jgi:23S rRNA (uracil1939-C5)-methyltransferase